MNEKKMVKSRIREDNEAKATLRGFAAFIVGLILTAIYALIVLFIKNYNVWFCIASTITIGFFLSLGMAFSIRVRMTVLLMLPEIFSTQARLIVLFVAFSMLMQGPAANVVENLKRTSQSAVCGAELALNETKEMLSKATKPIMNFMKKIVNKVHVAAESAKKFFTKLSDALKHVVKELKTAWAFITNIGDYCNEEMERPYLKCNKAFDDAKNRCFAVMSFLGFLCYILDIFRPLCGLARIIVIICLIPQYVEGFLQKHIKNPVVSRVKNFKDQFNFNITYLDDDKEKNITISVAAANVFSELKERLEMYKEMLAMFTYSMLLLCIFYYFKALRYRRKYMTDDNHDNVYITREFIELDVMRVRQNRENLLPLSSSEGYGLIRPGSIFLTKHEKKGYVFDIINVFRSLLVAVFIISIDYVFFWLLDLVSYLMSREATARTPQALALLVNGTGVAEGIYTAIASAFGALQRSNITAYTKKCKIQPSEPNYLQYLVIGFLHGFALCIALFGVYMQRLRRYICAYYYPTRERMRICFLYNQLLTKRSNLAILLFQSIWRNEADKGHNNILLILAAKCPFFFSWLAKFVGANQQYCMACGQICTSKNSEEYHYCTTPGCKGIYCAACAKVLKNSCTLCMGPLLIFDFEDEVIDSSDDEKHTLWIEGMKSIKKDEKTNKKKMRKSIKGRLKENFRKRGKNDLLIQKYKESKRSSDSEESSGLSDVDTDEDGESDMEYQNSKVREEAYYQDWSLPSRTGDQKPDPITLPGVQDKTTGDGRRSSKERDVEKGPGYSSAQASHTPKTNYCHCQSFHQM